MPKLSGDLNVPTGMTIGRMRRRCSEILLTGRLAVMTMTVAADPATAQNPTAQNPTAQNPTGAVALLNATVVDVEAGVLVPRQTIVIRNGRIVAMAARASIPVGAMTVDLAGRFVIPGLWDMHVHRQTGTWFDALEQSPRARAAALTYFRTFLIAAGVTGIRDLGGDLDLLRAGDAADDRADRPRPRAVITGGKLGSHRAVAGAPHPLTNAEEVRQAVEGLHRAGAAHVKLAPGLPPLLVRAALPACRRVALPCVAHAPAGMTIAEASAMGLANLEHLFGLPEQTSSLSAAQFAAWSRERARPTFTQRVLYKLRLRKRPPEVVESAIATHDSVKAAALFRTLAAQGLWISPTLTMHDGLTRVGARDWVSRDARYLIDAPDAAFMGETRTPESRAQAARLEALQHQLVRGMRDAGVGILAGTDTPVLAVPGASLHGELILLQRAGLTPAEALRAATVAPARYLRATDSLGTVRVGRVADLVVLRENPLADVRNTRAIDMVVTRGNVLRRADLDRLLDEGTRALQEVRAAIDRANPAR